MDVSVAGLPGRGSTGKIKHSLNGAIARAVEKEVRKSAREMKAELQATRGVSVSHYTIYHL